MRVVYASDLHLEMNKGPCILGLLQANPDVLILAGDIHTGAEMVVRSMERYQEAVGCHVVLVAGNHEYYDLIPVQKTDAEIENLTRNNPKLHFLHNSSVMINGIKFLGGTLWTDFGVDGPDSLWYTKDKIRKAMNDFRYITVIRKNGDIKKLTTDYWSGFHNKTRDYIYRELKATPADMKTVVVTHHGGIPTLNGTADWKQSYRAGYVSDIREIWDDDVISPCYWVSGHTHEQMDQFGYPTKFLINCYGYEEYESILTGRFKWKFFNIDP